MLKTRINECRIKVAIQPQSAVLIKAGESVSDGVDMAFVRTMKDGIPQVFLPGSSLKGVMRSHGESILRTFEEEGVCNPFLSDKEKRQKRLPGPISCSDELAGRQVRGKIPAHERYERSCPACKLFGSLAYGGRFNIWDAYTKEGEFVGTEFRDGVGIDRFTGGAFGSAKYQFEVITSGTFHTEVTLKNFELWQLAWVLFVLKDFAEGLVPIGMGTSRGLGKVKLFIESLEWDCFTLVSSHTKLYGVDGGSNNLSAYGIMPAEPIEIQPSWQTQFELPRFRVSLSNDQVVSLTQAHQSEFTNFLKGLQPLKRRQAS